MTSRGQAREGDAATGLSVGKPSGSMPTPIGSERLSRYGQKGQEPSRQKIAFFW